MAAFDEARAGRGGLVLLTRRAGDRQDPAGADARRPGAERRRRRRARARLGRRRRALLLAVAAGRARAGRRPRRRAPRGATSAPARAGSRRSRPRSASGSACPRPTTPPPSPSRPASPSSTPSRCSCAASPPTRPSSCSSTTSTPADLPSLLLLAFLARALADVPVLVVSTHHDAGPSRGPEVEGDLRRAQPLRAGASMLGGLDGRRPAPAHRPPQRRRAARTTSSAVSRPSPRATRSSATRSSGCSSPTGQSTRPGDRLPLPDGVRDAIRRRLQPLSPEAREALEVAAVAGRGFRVATLERAAGDPAGRDARAPRRGARAAPPRRGAEPGGGVPLRPRAHPRDALQRPQRDPPRATARRGRRGARARGRRAGRRAGCSSSPTTSSRRRPAGDAAPRARLRRARRRTRRCARSPTSRRPTSSTRRCGSSTSRPSPTRSGAASSSWRAARRRCSAGEDAARDCLLEAVALAQRLERRRPARPRGAEPRRLRPLPRRSSTTSSSACSRRRWPPSTRADRALRARLLVRLAVAIYWSQQPDRREALVDEAIAIARRLGDPATLAFVLDQGRIATSGPDNLERELAWVHELFALSEQLGDHESAVRARVTHIDLLLELDDLPAADMAIADARPHRDRRPRPARALVHPAAPRPPRAHGGPRRGGRAPDRRGREARLEPARLNRPDPRRRAAVRVAPRAGPPRRARDRRAPVRRQPAGDARVALRARGAVPRRRARGRRRGASSSASRRAASPTSRATTCGWSAMSLLAELCEGLADGERAAEVEQLLAPFAERNVVSPEGIFGGPVHALSRAVRGRARASGTPRGAYLAAARRGGRAAGARPDARAARPRRGALLAGREDPATRTPHGRGRARPRARGLARGAVIGETTRTRGGGARRAAHPSSPRDAGPTPRPRGDRGLRREGDVWRVEHEGRTRSVRDAKGLATSRSCCAPRRGAPRARPRRRHAEGSTGPRARGERGGRGMSRRRAGGGDVGRAARPEAKRSYRTRLETARRARGGRVVQRPRARGARARGDRVHRARALERRRPRRARPQGRRRTPSAPA